MRRDRRRAAARTATLAALPLLLPACAAGDADRPAWAGTRDTLDGVEIVRNPEAPVLADGAVAATVVWTAGESETATDDAPVWEQPGTVRVGDGTVYVLDLMAGRVYAHRAEDGAPLAVIGRKGAGPGEVERPTALAVLGNEIMVGDAAAEIEVFGPSGQHVRSIRPDGFVLDIHALASDRVLLERFQGPDAPPWVVLDASGESRPLDRPEWRVDAPEGVDACSADYAFDRAIYRVRCALLHLQIVDDRGGVLREITVDRAPEVSTEAELDAYEQRLRETFARMNASPASIQQAIEEQRERNRIKRIFRDARRDPQRGWLWVREQPAEDFGGGPAILHLFRENGVYLARIPFGRAWSDFDAAGGRIYALARDPETDLASLVAYRIEVPEIDIRTPGAN